MGCPCGRYRVRLEPHDDGLILPEVGQWAKRKYHFLQRYLDIFSTGMKKWSQRHYIDLFAGAGFARIKETNEIVAGSPVIAANVKTPFTCIHACERDATKSQALKDRLDRASPPIRHRVVHADANSAIDELLQEVPSRGALCITFVDPYGLHFDFRTAQCLASIRSDLIVLLADRMDVMRNWETYYRDNPESRLDSFLGDPGWREGFLNKPSEALVTEFRERYIGRLRTLGYEHFDSEPVQNSQGVSIYRLLFATRNPVGLKFWRQASLIDEQGQRGLFPD